MVQRHRKPFRLPVVMSPKKAREVARPIRVAKDASAYTTIDGAAAKAKAVFAKDMRCIVKTHL